MDVMDAHKHSANHRKEIEQSDQCGCFYCLSIYPSGDVTEWCDVYADEVGEDPYGHTALCPNCDIDSVIGSASGYPVTLEFLTAMKKVWF